MTLNKTIYILSVVSPGWQLCCNLKNILALLVFNHSSSGKCGVSLFGTLIFRGSKHSWYFPAPAKGPAAVFVAGPHPRSHQELSNSLQLPLKLLTFRARCKGSLFSTKSGNKKVHFHPTFLTCLLIYVWKSYTVCICYYKNTKKVISFGFSGNIVV